MQEEKYITARNIESALMDKLSKFSLITEIPEPSTESESPVIFTNTASKNIIQAKNYSKTKISIFSKPKSQQNLKKQVKIDDLGQAAEWADIGTKHQEEQSNEQMSEGERIQSESPKYDTEAIKIKMQNKAHKIAHGGLVIMPSNANRLLEKARGIREQNQRQLVPKQSSTIISPSTKQLKPDLIIKKVPLIETKKFASESDSEEENNTWNAINQRTLQTRQQQVLNKNLDYTVEEIKNYYMNLDLLEQKKQLCIQNLDQQIVQNSGFLGFLGCFSRKKVLNPQVKSQMLALTKCYISEDIDVFLLQSIWKCLTQKKFMRFGNHWQQIGFQGQDPATDLRSTGILSLLLIFLYKQKQRQFLTSFYKVSRDQKYDFPMMITLIKIVGKYSNLVSENKIYGKHLSEYLQWFYAICHYTLNVIVSKQYDIQTIGQGVTDTLQKLDSKLLKIREQYINKK